MRTAITPDKSIRDFLTYDVGTGTFRWIKVLSNRVRVGDVAGCVADDGYRRIRFNGRLYLAHRLAWFFVHGVMPEFEIDHRHGKERGDGIANLRVATRAQNLRNQRAGRPGTSRFKGVFFNKKHQKWQADITINRRGKYLGLFDDEMDAALAYDAAAKKYFGVFARPNFMEAA